MADSDYIRALLNAEPFRSAGERLRLVETHISWVILTGKLAYKIKKPVRFSFVDFSTLDSRRAACLEELRLNRRLAPEIYLGVVPITGDITRPQLGGSGPAIDYAVKMRQFDPAAVPGEQSPPLISPAELDQLATLIADFHQRQPAAISQAWGTPESVWKPIEDSLAEIARMRPDAHAVAALAASRDLCRQRFVAVRDLIVRRRSNGFVRECHGDLHLGNIVRLGQRLVPFDALEFDPALRWIDVLNEVAFLVMDLETHRRRDLAMKFLNRYLAVTGDYQGLPVLPLYLAYRALVRAKVRLLAPGAQHDEMIDRLLAYSANPLSTRGAGLILMCGVSGSGKTVIAADLSAQLGAIHLRSDVERKRLAALPELARTGAALEQGIYAPEMSQRTYARLADLARTTLQAGLCAVVDATSLRRAERRTFMQLAHELDASAAIIYCTAPEPELVRRVSARRTAGLDASEADAVVLRQQLLRLEPPAGDEGDAVAVVETSVPIDTAGLVEQLDRRAMRP